MWRISPRTKHELRGPFGSRRRSGREAPTTTRDRASRDAAIGRSIGPLAGGRLDAGTVTSTQARRFDAAFGRRGQAPKGAGGMPRRHRQAWTWKAAKSSGEPPNRC